MVVSKGNFALITFSAVPNGKITDIHIEVKGSYPGMPSERRFTIETPEGKRHAVTLTSSSATLTL